MLQEKLDSLVCETTFAFGCLTILKYHDITEGKNRRQKKLLFRETGFGSF